MIGDIHRYQRTLVYEMSCSLQRTEDRSADRGWQNVVVPDLDDARETRPSMSQQHSKVQVMRQHHKSIARCVVEYRCVWGVGGPRRTNARLGFPDPPEREPTTGSDSCR